ncbi:MAG TPA: hypothetical protein VGP42_13270 [Stellaceae bacterium]|nr:hypothetical protein [Stellaceae bacterium]
MDWRERETGAAATLQECRRELARRGSTILREVTAGAAETPEWRRYPESEVYDPATHAQYFYHRHPVPARGRPPQPAEHGHFHLFLRAEGMPAGIAPLLVPELAVANAPVPPQSAPLKRGTRDEVAHLAAVAIDARGEPIRLFTTNRWVTGETWYSVDDMIRMLDRFELRTDAPSAVLNRWIGALVHLFQPEITVLLRNRDKAVQEWQWRWGRRGHVFEDTRLEITSSFDIDLEARLSAVERAAAEPAPPPPIRPRARLPRMAEGWGA